MAWKSVGPANGGFEALSDPVAVTDGAGAVEVFVGQPDGVSFVLNDTPPSGDWGPWLSIASPTPNLRPGALGAARVAVSHGSDRRLALFVSDDDPTSPLITVWYTEQLRAGRSDSPPGNWPDPVWTAVGDGGVPGTNLGEPVTGIDVHGAMHVFVAETDPDTLTSYLLHSAETSPDSGQFSGWHNLGGDVQPAYRPAVTGDLDGRLEVFVRGVRDNVQLIWQTSPGGGWSGWGSLGVPGGGAAGDVAAASNGVLAGGRAGCLEVLVVGRDGHLYQISQTEPGNGWGRWADLGTPGPRLAVSGHAFGPVVACPVIGDNGDTNARGLRCRGE